MKIEEYPIGIMTRAGCVRKRTAVLSADGSPRYEANPNSSNSTYHIQTCLNDGGIPIYSQREANRLNKEYEQKWAKKAIKKKNIRTKCFSINYISH